MPIGQLLRKRASTEGNREFGGPSQSLHKQEILNRRSNFPKEPDYYACRHRVRSVICGIIFSLFQFHLYFGKLKFSPFYRGGGG